MPPETQLLVRHRKIGGEGRMMTNDRRPPDGYEIDFDIGAIQRFSPPGTVRLVRRDGRFVTLPRGSVRPSEDEELGYLEQVPLPLFVGVETATLDDGSETLVVATDRDHLRGQARDLSLLGFIEGFPNEPFPLPPRTRAADLIESTHGDAVPPPRTRATGPALVRYLDRQGRRHVYEASEVGSVEGSRLVLSAELGRLATASGDGLVAMWVGEDGRVFTDRYASRDPVMSVTRLVRWSVAPVNWRGFASRSARLRAMLRRIYDSQRVVRDERGAGKNIKQGAKAVTASPALPIGYLFAEPGPGRIELFAAMHQVTRDQFLTNSAIEAGDMGYVDVQLLGYIQADAPLTGQLGSRGVAILWASRFGLAARRT
jgi:hypothetical protein